MFFFVPLLEYKNLCTQEKCSEQLLQRGKCKWCLHKPSSEQGNGKLSLGAHRWVMSELQKPSGGWQQAVVTGNRQGSCPRNGVFLLTGATVASEENRKAPRSPWKPMTKEYMGANWLRHCSLVQRTCRLMVLHWFSRSLWVRHVLSHLISVCVYDSSLEFFPAQILVNANETASESKTIIKYPRNNWITFLWGDKSVLFHSWVCLLLAFFSNWWVGTIHFQC